MKDKPEPMAHNTMDLTGHKYGRLLVLSYAGKKHNKTAWLCKCDCGNTAVVTGNAMRKGNTRSCGCLAQETKPTRTHGRRHKPEYQSWSGMKTRCTNPNQASYAHYGGRGIKVCKRWMNSFEAFFEDMGPRPKGHSLERIDRDGDYEPNNCRWATITEQANNTSQNNRIAFRGRKLTISEWAEETGIERRTIARRLGLGWSVRRALTEKPVVGKNQYSDHS